MSENKVQLYAFGDYRLHVDNCQLLKDDIPVSLTQKSFEVLLFLVENRGRILKKEELLDNLWEGNYVEEANLTQHIYMLRKALKQNGSNETYIETIPKNGYRFVAKVEEHFAENNGFLSDEHKKTISDAPSLHENKSYQTVKSGEIKQYSDKDTDSNKNTSKIFKNKLLYAGIGVLSVLIIGLSTYLLFFNNGKSSNTTSAQNTSSIAVLPFKQIDKEKDEKLGIGIADVLIARLANIEDVTVRPTTSIIRFANSENSDLFDIGNKLDVKYVIAGTIQRQDNIIRITTQLYNVEDKRQMWTEKFDEEYTDVFTLQDKISERIAQKLLANLDRNQSALPYKQYTKSVEAYKAYSMGLSYWTMHSKSGFEKAIIQFKKAIEKDPEFVNAYAYLADTYGHTSHIAEVITPEEARLKGEETAKKALELDENSAEALAALALIYANKSKQKEAFNLMKRAVELKPNDAHIRHRISWMYANKGDINKAVDEMKIAQKLDPQSAYINIFYAEILLLAKQPDKAIDYFKKGLAIEPDSDTAKWRLVEAYEQKEQFNIAEEQIQELIDENGQKDYYLLVLSRIYAKSEKTTEAKAILESILSRRNDKDFNDLIAYTEIALGEEEKALNRMKGVIASIQDNIYRLKYDSKLDPLRDNPTFVSILSKKEREQGW